MRNVLRAWICGLALAAWAVVGIKTAEAQEPSCPPTVESYDGITDHGFFNGQQGAFDWGIGQWSTFPNDPPLWPECADTILWMPAVPGVGGSTEQELTRSITLDPGCFLLNIVVAVHRSDFDGSNQCGTLTLSSASNQNIVQEVCTDDGCVTIDTSSWIYPAETIMVTFTAGSALGVVSLSYCCPDGCRVTAGGVDPIKMASGGEDENRYQFGGQAGAPTGAQPQPFGEWTHHQQRGPDGSFVFHMGTASAPDWTEIDRVTCSDPNYCQPARPAPFKQIDFEGVGSFKNMRRPSAILGNVVIGETAHWATIHLEDLGEPGKAGKVAPPAGDCPPGGSAGSMANCDCPDFYRIVIYEAFDPATESPDKTNIIYEEEGYIDGGNIQIHPPIG